MERQLGRWAMSVSHMSRAPLRAWSAWRTRFTLGAPLIVVVWAWLNWNSYGLHGIVAGVDFGVVGWPRPWLHVEYQAGSGTPTLRMSDSSALLWDLLVLVAALVAWALAVRAVGLALTWARGRVRRT
jgi:hypothetical protein